LKPFLLDVNVIVALLWRAHVHHFAVRSWFMAQGSDVGIGTCPITQAGAVRILGNPKNTSGVGTVSKAVQMLQELLDHASHQFWPIEIPLSVAIDDFGPLAGHQQITDAYLVALAKARGGELATLDRGVLALRGASPYVHLIS
jgi:toxin-antitoxin system PIN domain toxin